ncbi:PTS system glucoside-specific EIICBA component [Raoultella ornithinolytica]|nr:PTS system glucoside-specific EIICBA component [Raoultella ornithinolytica]
MLSQIQRFGGAMFTPVLLFPFAGIVVGIAIMLRNPMFVGEALTAPDSLFAQIVHIIEEGGWTVFRNMPLIFARRLTDWPREAGAGTSLPCRAGEFPDVELLHQRHGHDLGPLFRRRFFGRPHGR